MLKSIHFNNFLHCCLWQGGPEDGLLKSIVFMIVDIFSVILINFIRLFILTTFYIVYSVVKWNIQAWARLGYGYIALGKCYT